MAQYLTIKEVARNLRVSRSTIERLLREKRFPRPFKLRHQRFWSDKAIQRHLDTLMAKAAEEETPGDPTSCD